MKIHNVEQGNVQWYELRAGIPTASEFDKIITPARGEPSKSRFPYMCRIIAGRLMRWQADSLDKIEHIANGKANEPLAVAQLELIHDIETIPVGFITSDDGRFGASPDRIVMAGERIGITVECKCPTIPVQFERLLLDDDGAYRCQRQGQLWVAEADKAIFHSFVPGMPAYTVETGRDEPFLAKMADVMARFSDELEALMEKATRLGAYQAFSSVLPPTEAAYGGTMRNAPLMPEAELDDFIMGGKPSWGG